MNESQTQFDLIEPALKSAGWGVVEGAKIHKEYPIAQGRLLGNGKKGQPLKADYVLEYKNRKLAVIEAKAKDKPYTEGVSQAKDYAKRLQLRWTYATNGEKIYQIDMEKGREGDIAGYPAPDELWQMTVTDDNPQRQKFDDIAFESKGGKWSLRYYQENAINQTMQAIAAGRKRILLTLATGTGKTAIAFQIAWKLFHSRWNITAPGKRLPRILFLADRNILADQAFNDFSAFDDDALVRITPQAIRARRNVPTNGSVFFTIFQTFMSARGTPQFGRYPDDYFDLIIIDECHRAGANDNSQWRGILNYFEPAVKLGLTATPKRDENVDTYDYFGEPVYCYSLAQGINDGFLTPFQVKDISTTIDKYTYDGSDEVISGDIKLGEQYVENDFNAYVIIKEREEYRVKLFLRRINQNHKTLVFCKDQEHALMVRDLINQHSTSTNPDYCQRVTADEGKIGEGHLRAFQDNELTIPTILTTSHKLSTGVDAPEVRNIVLMRPINSMVEFKQIIGRGTRLYDNKDYFTIYDFVKAHKHFHDDEWDGPPLQPDDEKPPRVCSVCQQAVCSCEKSEPQMCKVCANMPCVCEKPPREMVEIKLSDSSVRSINSMVHTQFWNADGAPMSAKEFISLLYGELPNFFQSEAQLREIWSMPDTRQELLDELDDAGYTEEQLDNLKKLVNAEDSDLFDVLSYIAYDAAIVPRQQRSLRAQSSLDKSYNTEQRAFIEFILRQYVLEDLEVLNTDKLPDLITLNYQGIENVPEQLGEPESIRQLFIELQRYLYAA